MEIDSNEFIRELAEELQKVGNAMIQGVETWEEYLRLQARAQALLGLINSIEVTVKNRTEAEGNV